VASDSSNVKNTRERIIDCAEEVFAEKGFGGARIRDISERAGVTGAMIHYYFNSKEELLRAVLTRIVEDLVNLTGKVAPEPIPPVVKVELFFTHFFDYASRHRNFTRITSMETGHDNQEFFLNLIKSFLRPLYEEARDFLRRGMDAGVFRPIDPDHLLTAIYGMTMSYFSDSPFLEILMGQDSTTENQIDARRDLLMEMIMRILLTDNAQSVKEPV